MAAARRLKNWRRSGCRKEVEEVIATKIPL
jgi:hypothetical protein